MRLAGWLAGWLTGRLGVIYSVDGEDTKTKKQQQQGNGKHIQSINLMVDTIRGRGFVVGGWRQTVRLIIGAPGTSGWTSSCLCDNVCCDLEVTSFRMMRRHSKHATVVRVECIDHGKIY